MTLELSGLKVRYGPLEALHGVSLTVASGSVTAILGHNGAGKTSLLRAIAGNIPTSAGRIRWQGTDMTRTTPARRSGLGVMLIPDEGAVFPSLSVRENLELFAGRAGSGSDGFGPALEAFQPLEHLLDRRAQLLSGGEQQMLALSRAVLTPWRLLLVDELSHGLAPALASRLYAVLAGLVAGDPAEAEDRIVLLAEPHPRDAITLSDHVHVLRRGDVTFSGESAEFDPDSL